MATLGIPDTRGRAEGVCRYHHRAAVQRSGSSRTGIRRARRPDRGGDCRAGGRQHGLRSAAPGFLEGLRRITERHGALLIFDEVMTGFRVALRRRAAALRHHARSDDAGQDHRRRTAPRGLWRPRRHHEKSRAGGTHLSGGNAFGKSAGGGGRHRDAALSRQHPEVYDTLEKRTAAANCRMCLAGVCVNRVGSMFTFFLASRGQSPISNRPSRSDTARFGTFFHFLLERGIYFPPSQFEAGFLSAAHTGSQIRRTASAIREFFESE